MEFSGGVCGGGFDASESRTPKARKGTVSSNLIEALRVYTAHFFDTLQAGFDDLLSGCRRCIHSHLLTFRRIFWASPPAFNAYKMGQDGDTATQRAVGSELLAVLPKDGLPWYKKAHMLKLHFCVFSLIMFCMFSYLEAQRLAH